MDGTTIHRCTNEIVDCKDVRVDDDLRVKLNATVVRLGENISLINKHIVEYKKLLEKVATIKNELKLCKSLYGSNLGDVSNTLQELNTISKCNGNDTVLNGALSSILQNKVSEDDILKGINGILGSNRGIGVCDAIHKVLLNRKVAYKVKHYINLVDLKLDCIKMDNDYKIVEIPTLMYLYKTISDSKDKVLYLYIDDNRLNVKVLDIDTQVDFSGYRYLGRYDCRNVKAEDIYINILKMLSK